jgi:RNA polymerase sigma-70 factor (ECF subfamily)
MKSRVSRGRAALQTILESGEMPRRSTDVMPSSEAFRTIMDNVDQLTANRPPAD